VDVARTFLALDPDEALRERLAAAGAGLRAHFPYTQLRWIAPANYHFTLVFLGHVAVADVARIHARVAALAPGMAPFAYRLVAARAFPSARSPRVIAALPDAAAGFLAWQQPLAAALAEEGFAVERRPYRPHLTLARWRGRSSCPDSGDFPLDLAGSAAEIRLYESREGRYWPLFSLPCGGAPDRA
jgi:2'-5' RNA ligase